VNVDRVRHYLLETSRTASRMAERYPEAIVGAAAAIVSSLREGGKLLICGNGGSARQVEALGRSGDVLVGISTSAMSANVVGAFEQARAQGLLTIALTGESGGKLAPLADIEMFRAPRRRTSR
jgi:phosphoheptose isomerase